MNRHITFLAILALSVFISCKTSQTIVEAPLIEEEILDTMVVSAPAIIKGEEIVYELDPYQASATRLNDLINTRLEIAFDWEKQHVIGNAELTIKAHFYESNILELDAKYFDIHNIEINGQELEYEYDYQKLKIHLNKSYARDESFTVNINYTAKPNEGPSGGSMAILSNKGLFFINPLGDNPNKPQQIWTQGETENNSRWFPTIDKPNERCSQEIFITVQDRFKTLSNGKLMSSILNEDGTRTDYWKQEKEHAPYLFMLGIGEYAVITDQWKDIPLMYYVEPEFADDAKTIFNHTPEMLEFFSKILDYPYPWDKYAQIVCKDYVSGAMENTGAVVFGESVQRTTSELFDRNNDDIVAHEMFHHWFGDLVTCESWSNLTLNEGFAAYSEYLWREYKYGNATAERKRLQDLNGYLMSSGQQGMHDLIEFEYKDKEQMFDGHSYNKGGLIIHMLRNYIGDEAFFASLNRFLIKNEYSDVEAHELRLAFEDVTGEDLNWFFNQWFYNQGHPVIEVSYNIIPEESKVEIAVDQIQDPENNPPIFQLPVKSILYFPSGKKQIVDSWINERSQNINIEYEGDEAPSIVVLDGTHDLLAIFKEDRTDQQLFELFRLSDEYEDKYNALKSLKNKPKYSSVFDLALKDKSKEIRALGISSVNVDTYKDQLINIALNDADSGNRTRALKKVKDYKTAIGLLESEKSFRVIAEALSIINKTNPEKAIKEIEKLKKSYYKPLIPKIAEIYAATKEDKYLEFFEKNIINLSMTGFFNFIKNYEKVAKHTTPERMLSTSEYLKAVAMDNSSIYFKKYAATNLINKLLTALQKREDAESNNTVADVINKLSANLTEIVSKTSDTRLKSSFKKFNTP